TADFTRPLFPVTDTVFCQFTNTELPKEPNLSISKTDHHVTAVPGETLTYEVTVTNSGAGGALHVKVDDTLPGFLSDPFDISDFGVFSAGHIVWNGIAVDANSSKTLTFKATINTLMPNGTTILHNEAKLGCEEVPSTNEFICPFTGTATDDT